MISVWRIRNNDVFVHVIFMYIQATVQFRLKFNVLYYLPLFGLVGTRNPAQNHFLAIDRYQSVLSSTFFSQKENFILRHVEKDALCRSHKMIQAVELNQYQETLQSLFQGNPKSEALQQKQCSKQIGGLNHEICTQHFNPSSSVIMNYQFCLPLTWAYWFRGASGFSWLQIESIKKTWAKCLQIAKCAKMEPGFSAKGEVNLPTENGKIACCLPHFISTLPPDEEHSYILAVDCSDLWDNFSKKFRCFQILIEKIFGQWRPTQSTWWKHLKTWVCTPELSINAG